MGLCVLALAACKQGEDEEKPSKEAASTPAEESGTKEKTTEAPAEVAPAAVTATPAPIPDSAVAATPTPTGRSAVPKLDEWNAVTKEVTVRGSSKLHCETKMVREWLRVSCRGKNDTGGAPQSVTVTKGGGRGDDFAFSRDGEVASLVVRFVEGVDLEARFTWSDTAHTLRVWWPRGAPEPASKGEFVGAGGAGDSQPSSQAQTHCSTGDQGTVCCAKPDGPTCVAQLCQAMKAPGGIVSCFRTMASACNCSVK